MKDISHLEARLGADGLRLRGGFHPEGADRVPPMPSGGEVATLFLIGAVGPSLWPSFTASPEAASGDAPLDRWSRHVIDSIAAELGGVALYPFGGLPYLPFVAWAKRAEPVAESPIGMLIHPDHGLWHAYRGALGFAERLPLPPQQHRPRPCDACVDRPCLSACPVGAFDGQRYAVDRCLDHLATEAGADCMEEGCRARRACPVGVAERYAPAQAAFHMRAFFSNARARQAR